MLKRIVEVGRIFDAWDDEEWTVDGADVRVSLVCFDKRTDGVKRIDGNEMPTIFADLSSGASDLTTARALSTNKWISFQGPVKVGAFDIEGELARRWLRLPLNPNGFPNSDVLKPWANGTDIARRSAGKWIIDFGEMSEQEASLYEAPFEYVRKHIKPKRDSNRDFQRRENWWRLGRSGADLKHAVSRIARQIVTPRVAKHRVFVWMDRSVLPDSRLVTIARDDDVTFGIVHSRFHELWSLRLGGWHGVGNDPQYTPSLGFETFPFPEGLTPNNPAAQYARDSGAQAIAAAAQTLNERRDSWLNPSNLVKRVPEVVAGFPDLILPANDAAAAELKKRTLTNLYNQRPAWLDNAHKALDAAVAAAYAWPSNLSVDEIFARLLSLNARRAADP